MRQTFIKFKKMICNHNSKLQLQAPSVYSMVLTQLPHVGLHT